MTSLTSSSWETDFRTLEEPPTPPASNFYNIYKYLMYGWPFTCQRSKIINFEDKYLQNMFMVGPKKYREVQSVTWSQAGNTFHGLWDSRESRTTLKQAATGPNHLTDFFQDSSPLQALSATALRAWLLPPSQNVSRHAFIQRRSERNLDIFNSAHYACLISVYELLWFHNDKYKRSNWIIGSLRSHWFVLRSDVGNFQKPELK